MRCTVAAVQVFGVSGALQSREGGRAAIKTLFTNKGQCLQIMGKGISYIGMEGSSESGIFQRTVLSWLFDVCGLKYLIQENIYIL